MSRWIWNMCGFWSALKQEFLGQIDACQKACLDQMAHGSHRLREAVEHCSVVYSTFTVFQEHPWKVPAEEPSLTGRVNWPPTIGPDWIGSRCLYVTDFQRSVGSETFLKWKEMACEACQKGKTEKSKHPSLIDDFSGLWHIWPLQKHTTKILRFDKIISVILKY
jgi:hypothetical protein